MNEFKRANLAKLADCLDTLPDDYENFDMVDYVSEDGDPIWYTKPEEGICGTAACAIGHAPSFGFEPMPGEDWDEYSDRLFVDSHLTDDFEWMFDGYWSKVDNSVSGAALRIRWYLEHGLPDDAQEQKSGEVPLCYKEQSK